MVLETFAAVNSAVLATRAINTKIEKDMRDKILSESLYHVTTEENAQKIMESGYIKPSNHILSLGAKKCFFFAGLPSYRDLSSNCAKEATSYEFKAIKLSPNEEELSKFRQRSFNDDSITFKGKCDLPKERTEVVDLVLDIDEKGNIYTREKTEQELEKYVPKDELIQKMKELGNNNLVGVMGKAYVNEYKTVGQKIFKKISALKNIFSKEKTESLPEASVNQYPSTNMIDELKDNLCSAEESYILDEKMEEKNNKELNIENKELI